MLSQILRSHLSISGPDAVVLGGPPSNPGRCGPGCPALQLEMEIVKLQAQMVLLEERLRLMGECNEQLQRQAALLEQRLAAATAAATAAVGAAGAATTAADINGLLPETSGALVETAGSLSTPPASATRPLSAFAVLAKSGGVAPSNVASMSLAGAGNPSSCSSNSTPVPMSHVQGLSRSQSLSATPSRNSGVGSGSSAALVVSSPACSNGLLALCQEGALSLSSLPHASSSIAALARSTSSHQQLQQQQQQQLGASSCAAHPTSSTSRHVSLLACDTPAVTNGTSSSSQDFTQDAEVWPVPQRPNRSRSLLSARELGLGLGSSCPPPPAAAAAAVAAASHGPAMLEPTKPIMVQPHSRHVGTHAHQHAPGAAAGQHDSWQTMAALTASLGAAGSSASAFGLSPASWEHPLLLASRQGSMLDALPGTADAVSAAATAEYLAMAGIGAAAAAAAAAASGLVHAPSDRMSQDSGLAGMLPFDVERLVSDGSYGSLPAAVSSAAAAAALGPSGSSAGDLQQALMAQQLAAAAAAAVQQKQGHQSVAAAAAAAVAAATIQQQQKQQSGITVHGGKLLQIAATDHSAAPLLRNGLPCPLSGAQPSDANSSREAAALRSRQSLVRASSVPATPAMLCSDEPLTRSCVDSGSRGMSESLQLGCTTNEVAAQEAVLQWEDSWAEEAEADAELRNAPDESFSQHNSDARLAAGGSTNSSVASTSRPCSSSPCAMRSASAGVSLQQAFRRASRVERDFSAASAVDADARDPATRDAGADAGDGDGVPGQELDAAAQNARLRSKQDACPNTCVYVGFLGWWVSERDLLEYFGPYGELVSVRLLISKKSRRSREQAFVEYAAVEQAQKAITWLDSIDYPALVKQLGCGGLVVRFADRKKPAFDA